MLRQLLFGCACVMGGSSLAAASQLITPAGWGSVPGSGAYEAPGMFDHQPTWDGSALVGGDESYTGTMAPWDPAGATAYMDFGADYAQIQIEQIWTQGMAWRPTDPFPCLEVWWDNDVNSTTLVGDNVASTINFNTKGSLGGATWIWQRDFDYSASPITPAARYLKLRVPVGSSSNITATTEYAIIGSIPEPTSLTLIGLAAASLLTQRQRKQK